MPSHLSRHDRLARETGGWKKKWTGLLPVALLFPNHYRVGMSNLGLQLVYELANRHPEIVCERIFLPEETSQPLSVESGRPLRDFPVILCSFSFEPDFLTFLKILLLGGIEPTAAHRLASAGPWPEASSPLVIGGGVATFINPEPLAPFLDLAVIGEAEATLGPLLDFLVDQLGKMDRAGLLWELAARLPGCYAPHFYSFTYEGERLAAISAPAGLPPRIRKATAPPPSAAGHSQVLTPDAEFADLFLTELGRGCSRGCRFCAAGFVYRPPRLWSAAAIKAALAARPARVRRIGLLGMEMARGKDLAAVSDYLLGEECSLSFSSLRADVLSPSLIALLGQSGLKTAAIAPDGGSERLRRVINKGLTEENLLGAAEALARVGILNLKLYFMIGLPTEEQEDLEELIGLTLRIRERIHAVGRERGRLCGLTLSVNSLVPKAWTPFQYYGMAQVADLKQKLKFIRQRLSREANIRVSGEPPEKSFFQAVLARGDRRVGEALPALLTANRHWRQVFREQGIAPEAYANRERAEDELFPWEIIDHGLDREYLWREYQRALQGRTTPACDPERCRRCGVCS